MEFTINTESKTISFNSNVNIGDLVKQLKKFMPKDEWKEYELISITSWVYPTPYYQPNQTYWDTNNNTRLTIT
jgi:hypothetical protein